MPLNRMVPLRGGISPMMLRMVAALPRAVSSQQADDFSLVDCKGYAEKDMAQAIVSMNFTDLKHHSAPQVGFLYLPAGLT